jgi:putative CocE/NonD family hydrolase
VFDTPPLDESIEVTGPVSATIFAGSDCPDTVFTTALMDVGEDGSAIILCEGICRARFRNGTDRPTMMNPGEIYEFRIDMWDTSNLFLQGHRIRLEVSSSNFPRYDRNLNSGGLIGFEGP